MENVRNESNPWLGLKTYEEGQILYGRTEEINTLSQNILFNVQTVIYGKSGIGKSSILNAGIFPILRRSNFFPVNIRLVHNQPEKSYNAQIWECVIDSLNHLRKERLAPDGTKEILKNIKGRHEELAVASGNESLWEMFHRNVFYDDAGERIQPVLVFDQFEEIFTREKDANKVTDFFNELADLINNVVPAYLCNNVTQEQESANSNLETNDDLLLEEEFGAAFADYLMESNFHIVLSLREDFLSYLERNIANIPLLKHNRYCLKPLNEEQAASIIMDPAPGLVNIDVAKEIISKVTGVGTDKFGLGDEPEVEVDSAILSLFMSELYERIPAGCKTIEKSLVIELGDNIIQGFYERTISKISADCAEYLEYKLITEDGRRDSIFESHVIKHKGYKAADLEYLKKQRLIREFPWNDGIRIEFIHDVLCPIIVQRKEERKLAKKRQEEERLKELERERVLTETKKKEERLRKKNRNIIITSISTFAAVILLLLGYLYYDVLEYKEYYETYVWRYEMPYGINRLSKKDLKNRSVFYEFSKDGRNPAKRWKSIRALNSTMNLTTENAPGTLLVPTNNNEDDQVNSALKERLRENCIWEVVTDQSGKQPMQVKFYDRKHKLICCFSMVCHIEGDTLRYVTGQYTDEHGQPIQSRKNGASVVKITFDKEGFRSFIEYFDSWENRARNYDNALAQRYEYNHHPDSLGLLMRYGSANAAGEYVYDKVGNSGMKMTYINSNGKWLQTKSISIDPDGNVCPVKYGYSITKYEYDEFGRVIKQSYFDAEHNPVVDLSDNTHCCKIVYDEQGNICELYYYGIDGELKSNGRAYLKRKVDPNNNCDLAYTEYDREGNIFNNCNYRFKYEDERNPDKITEIYNVDRDDNCIKDNEGVYITRYTYDEDGNRTGEIYYENDGITPMLCKGGYAGVRRVYENGWLIEECYLDKEGLSTPTTSGYAKIVYSYDSKGNRIEETYYDRNDRKYLVDRYCSIVCKYDAFNNLIQKNYKDEDGKNAKDYVVKKYTYDFWGNLLTEANYKSDETTSTLNGEKIHSICYEYDSLFYVSEIRYYNEENKLAQCPKDTTYSIVRYANDEYGNHIITAFYDKYGNACESSEGFHKAIRTFNTLGNVVTERYYDSDKNRVMHSIGCWEAKVAYDKSFINKQSVISGYDKQGNLMNTDSGWAYKTFKYDNLGNTIEIAYFDKDSIPCIDKEEICHKVIKVYDGTNEIRTEYYKDATTLREKNAIITLEYDTNDNPISVSYYNGDGSNGEHVDGWHCKNLVYDNNKRVIEVNFTNAAGLSTDVKYDEYCNCCKVKFLYDEGVETEWRYMANGDSMCINGYTSGIMFKGGIYSGYIAKARPHGKGMYISADGISYEGDWHYGSLHGKGKFTFSSGLYYIGDFSNNKFNGIGSLYTSEDSLVNSGFYYEDKFYSPVLININETTHNSYAEMYGIYKGDVILEYNDFNYFKEGNKINDINKLSEELSATLKEAREKKKYIKVARMVDGEYVIKEFNLPPGEIGVYIQSNLISSEFLDKIYDAYMK